MNNFDWLEEFISELPKLSDQRKNLIEISGYPSWENVNSNLLTFYFNETESHGFGKLFINSLLDLLTDHLSELNINKDIFFTPFKVERERNRIDILITGYEEDENNSENYKWAILIENKIHAGLYNDLKKYWKSMDKPELKIGVALTLKGVAPDKLTFTYKGENIKFVNIYHSALIESIKSNLPEYFQQSDDRHLLFLKEYIMNIESHYTNAERDAQFEEKLKDYQKYVGKIHEFEKFKKVLHSYCVGILYEKMEQKQFIKNSSSQNIKSIHFYPKDDNSEQYKWFRFWIYFGNIEAGKISIYFELYGDSIKYGQKIMEVLRKKNIFNQLDISEGTSKGKEHYQIAGKDNHYLGLEKNKLSDALDGLINKNFFNEKMNLIQEVTDIIKEIEEGK